MARPPPSDPLSSDDDAPEAVSHSISKRNAKQVEKTLRDFKAEENARKKAHNRERDRKLKERAVVTRLGKLPGDAVRKGKGKASRESIVESDGSSAEDDETIEDTALEMRMRRAMEDAAGEMDGGDDDESGDDDLEDVMDEEMDGGSGDSDMDEEMAEFDAEGGLEEDGEMTDGSEDESADEDQPTPSTKSSTKAQYLDDELFASAFASQSAHATADTTATRSLQKAQPSRKRQRRPLARAKDLLVGTRTIRTLSNPLGSKIHSTAHTIPPQKIRRFINQSLAIKGRLGSAKAKARGWERRPVNVGIMKCIGAPSGFVRDKR
ncbi:uncharacterized protein EDB91DRAFT_1220332 [Suillus paluster]|uniref:uncharacterized protein n=1 Tax=Suillus paluster TaxID=48578 RepID=UPI001B86E160|nr:uncharacterized protein EDB91DRAFT_1220332 [Suillus paluster]KAG1745391.1 hypothetical protein EDB91DRAFT_1220332 [Suillus paluster]